MKNIFVLGMGRSGTSMLAGMFRESSAFLGNRLLAASPANPLGFFEDHDLVNLNGRIIDSLFRWPRLDWIRRRFAPPAHFNERWLWLAAPASVPEVQLPGAVVGEIKQFTDKQPFCYKDPRFCVTLDYWRPFLPPETRFLVVFREPEKSVESILRMAKGDPCRISAEWAYYSWWINYERLLKQANGKQWMFVHYDQIVSLEAVGAIEDFVGTRLCTSHIDHTLSRSRATSQGSSHRVSQKCKNIYRRLCERAQRMLPGPCASENEAGRRSRPVLE